jgi:predicted TIM-barrel fold metal-dependent hydrolase
MHTRRSFFKLSAHTLGGLSFCSCSMLQAKADTPNKSKKSIGPLVINGQRIKTIDVHAHCYFQEAIDLMGEEAKSVLPPVKGVKEHFIAIHDRIAAMNAQGIDLQVLSINPFWYKQSREVAKEICRINNEKLSELCRTEPSHFAAFASLAMQFPDLAVEQLEHAVKNLGLKGAAIGASVLGEDFSASQFHPVLAKAQELGALLFIHPQSTPELAKRFKGNGWLSNTIGNPLDTTIALQHLIFEGILDKFPSLKILAAHGGGYLGSYGARSDHSCFVSPVNCDPKIVLKKAPSEYLRQIYFDNLVFTSEALQFLASQVGVSQLMIGTDHPIPWEENPIDLVMNAKGFNASEKIQMLSSNAARLLKI